MPKSLAIDFGNASTLVALWHSDSSRTEIIEVPPYSTYASIVGRNVRTAIVPSIVYYNDQSNSYVGAEIYDHNLLGDSQTYRQLKKILAYQLTAAGESPEEKAAITFLSSILRRALELHDLQGAGVTFTAPVQASEIYTQRLKKLAGEIGFGSVTILDEPVAAALSLIEEAGHEEFFLIFDFGAYTLDVALVQFILGENQKQCKVLAKQSLELAGEKIDHWVKRYMEDRPGASAFDYTFQRMGTALLMRCREAKELLSAQNNAEITIPDTASNKVFRCSISRPEFDEMLKSNKLLEKIDEIIDKVMHPYADSQVSRVLQVGGSSHIPLVRTHLANRFGRERVLLRRPMEAVVTGAAMYASGIRLVEHEKQGKVAVTVRMPADTSEKKGKVPVTVTLPADRTATTSGSKISEAKATAMNHSSQQSSTATADVGSDTTMGPIARAGMLAAEAGARWLEKAANAAKASAPGVSSDLSSSNKAGGIDNSKTRTGDKHPQSNAKGANNDKGKHPQTEVLTNPAKTKDSNTSTPKAAASEVQKGGTKAAGAKNPPKTAPATAKLPSGSTGNESNSRDSAGSKNTTVSTGKNAKTTSATAKESAVAAKGSPKGAAAIPNDGKAGSGKNTTTTVKANDLATTGTKSTKPRANDLEQKLRAALKPHKDNLEGYLWTLVKRIDRGYEDISTKQVKMCQILRDHQAISSAVYKKLVEIVRRAGETHQTAELHLDSAQWAVMVMPSIDRWLDEWCEKSKRSRRTISKDWQVPQDELKDRLLAAWRKVHQPLQNLARNYDCHGQNVDTYITRLINKRVLSYTQGEEIRHFFQLAAKVERTDKLGATDSEYAQWHILVQPSISSWLRKANS